MAYSAGDLQVGFGEESSWNNATFPTVNRFLEVTDENIKLSIDRIESKGLRTQRSLASKTNWSAGNIDVSGDFSFELNSRGMGLLFKHILGATPSTTTASGGTSAKTHTIGMSPSDIADGKSLGFEIGRTDVTGTRHRFRYSGCKIPSFELSCSAGEVAMGKCTLDAAAEAVSTTTPTSPSYLAGVPLVFTGAAVNVAGSSFAVKSFDLKVDQSLKTDRYVLGSSTKLEQIQTGLRSVTGSMGVEWSGLTAYQRFTAGTTASVSVTFATMSAIEGSIMGGLTITLPDVRFDGETPMGGGQIVEHNLPFVVLDDESTNISPVTFAYTSLDTTP